MDEPSIAAYRVPRPPFPVDLRLDGTETPSSAPDRLDPATIARSTVSRYPDASALEARIAAGLGVEPERILVTAGADEALDRACRVLLGPGRTLVLPVPTFEMIERYVRLAGGSVAPVPWTRPRYPLEEVIGAAGRGAAAIAVVSPNNPTGAVARRDDLARLAEACPEAVLLVDLAYVEFADDDVTAFALALPCGLVVRTFSKAWGLPGLRVGYAAGPSGLIRAMRAAGGPYSVSSLSLALVSRRLETGGAAVAEHVARVRAERRALEALLRERGAVVPPSQGNFVLARFASAVSVWTELARRGIAVRSLPASPGLEDALRISLPGDARAFGRLAAALREILPLDGGRRS